MMWSMWNAPSDGDYYDQFGWGSDPEPQDPWDLLTSEEYSMFSREDHEPGLKREYSDEELASHAGAPAGAVLDGEWESDLEFARRAA